MTVPVSEVDSFVEPSEGTAGLSADQIAGRSPGQIAWQRIKRDKVTVGALIVVGVVVVLAILAPILHAFHVLDPSTPHPDLVQGPGSVPTGPFGGVSVKHLLGVVPASGTDLLSRVFLGITLDLSIALAATVMTVAMGVGAGLAAGFYGRWTDGVLGRLMDLILAFPQLLMLLALSPLFIGQPAQNTRVIVYLILVFAIFGWPYFARIVRGEVLSLREREFVEAARSLGARGSRILWKEMLPNLRASMLVYATIIMPTYVAEEAALAYLGVSVDPSTTPTVGNLLSDSVNYSQTDPTYFLVPGLTLVLIVLSFNLLGDGLGDALNPKADRL
jgi:peptide/nickel transport system permease protein